jgi:chaperonin GroES
MKKKKGTSASRAQASKSSKKKVAQKAQVQKQSKQKAPITPLGDRVLLKPLSIEESSMRTLTGIIIPETVSKEKPEQGTIIAVGPGKTGENGKHVPVGVSVGDRVVFSKYGYDEVKVDGVEYYLVSEANILAVINK